MCTLTALLSGFIPILVVGSPRGESLITVVNVCALGEESVITVLCVD